MFLIDNIFKIDLSWYQLHTILCISNPGILLWNDVVKCLHVVDQSRKGKLMDALRKNIEENLCGKDINQTHFRKKKLCCNSKKIKAFWLLAQPKKMHFNRKSMQNQQKKGTRLLTLFLYYLGDQCQVWWHTAYISFWIPRRPVLR